eukprot:Lankesteria_metandrocarpae@DN7499_c0_g1_i1.p1
MSESAEEPNLGDAVLVAILEAARSGESSDDEESVVQATITDLLNTYSAENISATKCQAVSPANEAAACPGVDQSQVLRSESADYIVKQDTAVDHATAPTASNDAVLKEDYTLEGSTPLGQANSYKDHSSDLPTKTDEGEDSISQPNSSSITRDTGIFLSNAKIDIQSKTEETSSPREAKFVTVCDTDGPLPSLPAATHFVKSREDRDCGGGDVHQEEAPGSGCDNSVDTARAGRLDEHISSTIATFADTSTAIHSTTASNTTADVRTTTTTTTPTANNDIGTSDTGSSITTGATTLRSTCSPSSDPASLIDNVLGMQADNCDVSSN